VAVDTVAVAVSAEVPWVASAEVPGEALAEVTSVALGEVTRAASAEVAWRVWAEITMAMEDIVSAAATTTTAPVRITRHTAGPTPAPTEWRADFESCRRAAFAILNGPPGELAYNRTLALPGEPPAQLARHHSADVQQLRTAHRPIVLHQPKLLRT